MRTDVLRTESVAVEMHHKVDGLPKMISLFVVTFYHNIDISLCVKSKIRSI